jgi:hypothetical protein
MFIKLLPMPLSSSSLLILSCRSISFRSYIKVCDLLWIDNWYKIRDWDIVSFFYSGYPVFPAPFVEEVDFSPMHALGSFVKNQMDIGAWVLSVSSVLFHWSSCLFLCQYHAIFISLKYSLKSVLWYLQHCSFGSRLLQISEVFCASTWSFGLIFPSLWRISLEF